MKRMSFIIQFKIELLLTFTSCRKVLGKIPIRYVIYATRLSFPKEKCMVSLPWQQEKYFLYFK